MRRKKMKKGKVILGFILLSNILFAHDHILYTPKLDVSGETKVRMKALLAHPETGKKVKPASMSTNDEGKTSLPEKFFVVHNKQKTDLVSKVTLEKVSYDEKGNTITAYDFIYTDKDGLKGKGNWIFVMEGNTQAHGWNLTSTMKVIVAKDYSDTDFADRVAEGKNEIIPLTSPVKAWKEGVFRGKFVDKDGNPVKNAPVDIMFMNVDFDVEAGIWKGGEELPKVRMTTFTDDNGVFAFSPSRAGQWFIKGTKSFDREKKVVYDASLLVEFE